MTADLPTPRRPAMPGAALFESLPAGSDPAVVSEVAHRTAALLVRDARNNPDPLVLDRIRRLADDHGMEELAALWASSPASSLPGTLWRLYLLGDWVGRDAVQISREYAAGRVLAEVQAAVAGVADPPGPDELRQMIAEVLGGIAGGDYATTLDRAAAFTRIIASGRAELAENDPASVRSAARLLEMAETLGAAAREERTSGLR